MRGVEQLLDQTEIKHLYLAFLRHHHIRRLDVAMNNAVTMRFRQRFDD